MSKFTPGPWRTIVLSNGAMHVGPNSDGEMRVATIHKAGYDAQDTAYNARLIAAAPELLEAVKAMEKHFLIHGWVTKDEFEMLTKLSNAIITAEGS